MAAPAFTMDNRPTKAGLYYVQVDMPIRMRVIDLRAKLKGKLTFINNEQIMVGTVAMEDGTGKMKAIEPKLAARAIKEDQDYVKWIDDVVVMHIDGIAYAYGFYLYLKQDWPIPPGIGTVKITEFDKKGNITKDIGSNGHYNYPPPALGAIGVGAVLAIAGLVLLLNEIAYLLGYSPWGLTLEAKKILNKPEVQKFIRKIEKGADTILKKAGEFLGGLKRAGKVTIGIGAVVLGIKTVQFLKE